MAVNVPQVVTVTARTPGVWTAQYVECQYVDAQRCCGDGVDAVVDELSRGEEGGDT